MKSVEALVLDFRSRSLTNPWVPGTQDSVAQKQAVRIPFSWIWFSVPVPQGSLNSHELTEAEIQSNGLE